MAMAVAYVLSGTYGNVLSGTYGNVFAIGWGNAMIIAAQLTTGGIVG